MELNAEEVKRLLAEYEVVCDNCACNDGDEIGKKIMLNALSLINSQEQRIKELTEENERLSQSLANSKSILANSKADTVRKMQERLNKECLIDRGYEVLLEGTIDQIAKEIIGDTK